MTILWECNTSNRFCNLNKTESRNQIKLNMFSHISSRKASNKLIIYSQNSHLCNLTSVLNFTQRHFLILSFVFTLEVSNRLLNNFHLLATERISKLNSYTLITQVFSFWCHSHFFIPPFWKFKMKLHFEHLNF